ncbi:MAG: tetratricopeptide repeat protein [Methanoregulaceae archaeon]
MQIKSVVIIVAFIVIGWFLIVPALLPVIHYNPIDAKASAAIGDTLVLSNKSEFALYWYERAVAADPNSTDTLNKLGIAYQKTGNLTAANQVFEKVIEQSGNSTTGLELRANALVRQGKYAEAVTYYNKALEQSPNDATILVLKGDALLASAVSQQQAMREYAKNISGYGSGNSAQVTAYDGLKGMDSYQEAIASYQKAMQINPALTATITAKIMSVTMNQVSESQNILNDLNS